jgi:hypothetical protein
MAAKRLAELRHIGDPERAQSRRHSFRAYNQENLLISIVGVIAVFSVLLGVFIIRCHLELILIVPFITFLGMRFGNASHAYGTNWTTTASPSFAYPSLLAFDNLLLTETLFTLLPVGALLTMVKALDRTSIV